MSVYAVTHVLHKSPATGNDRLALIVIADEADNEGLNAFPSYTRIAKLGRFSRSTAIRAIERLELGGELLVHRPETLGRGRFNRYALTMGRDPYNLAQGLGWPAPALDEAVRAEWLQLATVPDLSASVDDDPGHVDNPASPTAPDTLEPEQLGDNPAASVDEPAAIGSSMVSPVIPDPKTQKSKTNPRDNPHPDDGENQDHTAASGDPSTPLDRCELCGAVIENDPLELENNGDFHNRTGFVRCLDRDLAFNGIDLAEGPHFATRESKAAPKAPSIDEPDAAPPTVAFDEAAFFEEQVERLAGIVANGCRGINRTYVKKLARILVRWALRSGLEGVVIEDVVASSADKFPVLPRYYVPEIQKRAAALGVHMQTVPEKLNRAK